MKKATKAAKPATISRTFAIPDIHGCCRTFRQLLFHKLELQKTDTLYLLGDYIDRGPDSKGVIDTILELQQEGYDVLPIKGNHEQMMLDSVQGGSDETLMNWMENGGDETLKSYKSKNDKYCIPAAHLNFLKSLQVFLTTESYIFVHAGLNFTLNDPLTETSEDFMLWSRKNLEVEACKIGNRKVIAGHTPRHLDEIEDSLGSDFIQLDNGCFLGDRFFGSGNLLALELTGNCLHIQKNID